MPGRVCVTFDNMGNAAAVGEGRAVGPDPGTADLRIGYPRLLDLLDEVGIRASFFVEGWNGVHHLDRVAELAARGHEVGLHGWVHEQWGALADDAAVGLVHDGTDALRACGVEPVSFRPPGGDTGRATRAALVQLGYTADAGLGDGEPSLLDEGLVLVPFGWPQVDGFTYLVRHKDDPAAPTILERAWIGAVDRAAEQDTSIVLIAHAFLSAVDGARFTALRRVIEHVAGHPDLSTATIAEVADATRRAAATVDRNPA